MRAVIYARYSSENQREASIEDQVRLCRARIEREGWRLAATYTDRAMSGASALRPGYQKLIEDARAGCFDIVVAEALDRLSRDQEDVAALYKRLKFAGVSIVTLAEGEITELHVGLKGTMNALFLKDLAQKTWRGLEGRARAGKSAGGLCYGYDVVRRFDARGEPIRGERVIDPAEAEVVRRIFREFADGKSPRALARQLNKEGIPGPGGRPWRDTTIRGHRQRGTGILNNELYIGRLVWNRLAYVKDPVTGKRRSRRNAPDAVITEEVPHLRIVDEALWQRVKARQEEIDGRPGVQKIKASRFWEKRRAQHLLTGLVFCAACGGAYTTVGRDYLACSNARGRGTCTQRRGIRRPLLEDEILRALRDELMAPYAVQGFLAGVQEETNARRAALAAERQEAERALAAVERKLDGLYDAIAEGLRSPGLREKLEKLEAERDALRRALSAPPPSPVRLHPNLAELYRRRVEELASALEDEDLRTSAVLLIRRLIERVVVTELEHGFQAELNGAIVNMVSLALGEASGTEKAVLDERTACSVKVVAGRGFEPLTFRL